MINDRPKRSTKSTTKTKYQNQSLTQGMIKQTAIMAASRTIYIGYIDVFKGKTIIGMIDALKMYAMCITMLD